MGVSAENGRQGKDRKREEEEEDLEETRPSMLHILNCNFNKMYSPQNQTRHIKGFILSH